MNEKRWRTLVYGPEQTPTPADRPRDHGGDGGGGGGVGVGGGGGGGGGGVGGGWAGGPQSGMVDASLFFVFEDLANVQIFQRVYTATRGDYEVRGCLRKFS